jgi:hypothetical protein
VKDGAKCLASLKQCLDDKDDGVIKEAMSALDRIRLRTVEESLASRARQSNDLTEMCMYLDALIDVMDPGDEFMSWPKVSSELGTALSPIMRKVLNDRRKKVRKALHDELQRNSKRRT